MKLRSLAEIKHLIQTNYADHLYTCELEWLVEQAETLQEIKKLTKIENMYLSDFAFEVLKIVEKPEIPTRKPRV